MDFVSAVIDEIALEGLDGKTKAMLCWWRLLADLRGCAGAVTVSTRSTITCGTGIGLGLGLGLGQC